jgi:hypothetical protein
MAIMDPLRPSHKDLPLSGRGAAPGRTLARRLNAARKGLVRNKKTAAERRNTHP